MRKTPRCLPAPMVLRVIVTISSCIILAAANLHVSLQCDSNATLKLNNNLKSVMRTIRNSPKNGGRNKNQRCPCANDIVAVCHTSDRFCESSRAEKSCSQVWNNVVITSTGGITDPSMTVYDYGHPSFSGTNVFFGFYNDGSTNLMGLFAGCPNRDLLLNPCWQIVVARTGSTFASSVMSVTVKDFSAFTAAILIGAFL